MRHIIIITFLLFSNNCFSQKEKEFSFVGPNGSKDLISFVTNELKSEDTLKPRVYFYLFKISSSCELTNVENLANLAEINPKIDSLFRSKIYLSKSYWIGSKSINDYRWIVMPIFLGNPPKTTKSSGANLFFSFREQISKLVYKFNNPMDKVIWIQPRYTMLGIEDEL